MTDIELVGLASECIDLLAQLREAFNERQQIELMPRFLPAIFDLQTGEETEQSKRNNLHTNTQWNEAAAKADERMKSIGARLKLHQDSILNAAARPDVNLDMRAFGCDRFSEESVMELDTLRRRLNQLTQKEFDWEQIRTLEGNSWVSSPDLARRFSINENTLGSRLARWQKTTDQGWFDAPNPGPRDPKFLYRVGAVIDIVKELYLKQ